MAKRNIRLDRYCFSCIHTLYDLSLKAEPIETYCLPIFKRIGKMINVLIINKIYQKITVEKMAISLKIIIFGNKNQFASAASVSPEQIGRIIKLERDFGYTLKRNLRLPELMAMGACTIISLRSYSASQHLTIMINQLFYRCLKNGYCQLERSEKTVVLLS